jgi:catechol 2,3-dioxygenase-like lactoylglutathione lyase family enzyme
MFGCYHSWRDDPGRLSTSGRLVALRTGGGPVADNARAARAHPVAHGVAAESLVEAPGVRYCRFADPDGHPLEACEVMALTRAEPPRRDRR